MTDYAPFVDSMADEMDKALNALLTTDGLPDAATMDPNDQEVRDRRRLFVAIARGVVDHLVRQQATHSRSPCPTAPVVTPEHRRGLA